MLQRLKLLEIPPLLSTNTLRRFIFYSQMQFIENNNSTPNPENLKIRPPIVSVMGHVDHGKTTLLDSLRDTNVAESEPGLITQHVSSFVVNFKGRDVTFIDTPGHAAFSGIRGIGAKINDITVLVVDTNEGIKPQTQEVIDLILGYQIPTVVALNKIDRKTSDISATEEQLVEAGIELESFYGSTISVPISGLKKLNLDKLVEAILREAEKLELHSLEGYSLNGKVLDVYTKSSIGTVATVIVKRGLLKTGSVIRTKKAWCRVRHFEPAEGVDKSKFVDGGKPGYPFMVTGWRGKPDPDDNFFEVENMKTAKIILARRNKQVSMDEKSIHVDKKVAQIFGQDPRTLYMIIKTDTAGSLNALVTLLKNAKPKGVKIEIVTWEVGPVLESDMIYADNIGAHVIAFNLDLDEKIKFLEKNLKVPVFCNNVIFRIIEYVKRELEEILEPRIEERIVGEAEILKLFKLPEKLQASGCIVKSGTIEKSGLFRVRRGNEVIFEGHPATLRHKKSHITKVVKGSEFGITFPNFNDCWEEDRVVCYQNFPVKERLVWNLDDGYETETN